MRLEHVNLSVNDIEKSRDFYCNILGLHVRWEGERSDVNGSRKIYHIGNDDCYIAIFEAADKCQYRHQFGSTGFNHFAFIVDDLDMMVAKLHEHEIEQTAIEDYSPGRRLYCYDPDGFEIELVQ